MLESIGVFKFQYDLIGKMAFAAFSPRLNAAGNSVRAQKAIHYLAGKLGVGIFGPNPE